MGFSFFVLRSFLSEEHTNTHAHTDSKHSRFSFSTDISFVIKPAPTPPGREHTYTTRTFFSPTPFSNQAWFLLPNGRGVYFLFPLFCYLSSLPCSETSLIRYFTCHFPHFYLSFDLKPPPHSRFFFSPFVCSHLPIFFRIYFLALQPPSYFHLNPFIFIYLFLLP